MRDYKELELFEEWSKEDKDQFTVNVIKSLVMDSVRNANSGHTGGALSSANFIYLLYSEFLDFNPSDPNCINRDRFVLSAGHESALLYSILYLIGWIKLKDIKNFRQLDSNTPGHPEVDLPGVEATTGPLGQGVGMAVGMAVAEAYLAEYFNHISSKAEGFIDHYTYVLAGDGDLQEPISLGAAALAGHWNLNKLVMYYDSNSAQISGSTERSDSTNISQVFEGLGWHIQTVNGGSLDEIRNAIQTAKLIERPSIIIGETPIAAGLANMEGDHNTHGVPLLEEEISLSKGKFGLPDKKFYVPNEAVQHFQKRFEELQDAFDAWSRKLKKLQNGKRFADNWNKIINNKMDELSVPNYELGEMLATRKVFGQVLEHFAESVPNIVGGSADLEPSNYTGGFAKKFEDFTAENRAGRNLAFGVREFPMATIMNGMALHGGIIPFGGTFLVFSDYAKPAIRLAAMQGIRVIHEFSHDSFYVGEDGPTHQPIEHIMSLRGIPNYNVFRPADPKETAACFKIAMESEETPSALLLTRQSVPVLHLSEEIIEDGVRKGAYTVLENSDNPEIVLIASGSEVSLAAEVAEKLKGKRIRVVSMPCWELFEKQSEEYRQSIIPNRGCLKVSLEAGITAGWEKYVGPTGVMIGIDHYGKSGPYKELAKEFGFTADQVVKKINQHIKALI